MTTARTYTAEREAALLADFAATTTFVPAESGVPALDPEPDDEDDDPPLEGKAAVRYVRTPHPLS